MKSKPKSKLVIIDLDLNLLRAGLIHPSTSFEFKEKSLHGLDLMGIDVNIDINVKLKLCGEDKKDHISGEIYFENFIFSGSN